MTNQAARGQATLIEGNRRAAVVYMALELSARRWKVLFGCSGDAWSDRRGGGDHGPFIKCFNTLNASTSAHGLMPQLDNDALYIFAEPRAGIPC